MRERMGCMNQGQQGDPRRDPRRDQGEEDQQGGPTRRTKEAKETTKDTDQQGQERQPLVNQIGPGVGGRCGWLPGRVCGWLC